MLDNIAKEMEINSEEQQSITHLATRETMYSLNVFRSMAEKFMKLFW